MNVDFLLGVVAGAVARPYLSAGYQWAKSKITSLVSK